MHARGTTNFLLAVIAAALLFGSGAVLGAIKWGAIAAISLIALSLGVSLFGVIVRGLAESMRDARDGFLWLYRRRITVLYLLIRIPAAPVLLPVYLWRTARQRNEGLFIRTLELVLGLVVGLVVPFLLVLVAVAFARALGAL